jgi:protein-disulfide isomerase
VTAILVLCAVAITSITVRREFFPKVRADISDPNAKPVQVERWERFSKVGHRMGPASARVTILEFADFECPVCARFTNGPLRSVRALYPREVAVIFRHWPLSYHRFALPTARAAECAAEQGRFEAFHDVVYLKQDSLGLKPYEEMAGEAGVTNLPAFITCVTSTQPLLAIAADTVAAVVIGGSGTPTIVINGLRLAGAPDSARFVELVRSAIMKSRS